MGAPRSARRGRRRACRRPATSASACRIAPQCDRIHAMRPKDDWDLADERGEAPPGPVVADGPSGWQAIDRLDAERAAAIRRRLEERLAQLDPELGAVERQ